MTKFFEKWEKIQFWAIFGSLCPNLTKKKFFQNIGHRQLLDITISSKKRENQKKLRKRWENASVTYVYTYLQIGANS